MDQKSSGAHSGIPRLSRLPQLRSTASSGALRSSQSNKAKVTQTTTPSIGVSSQPRVVEDALPRATGQQLRYTSRLTNGQSKNQPATPARGDGSQPDHDGLINVDADGLSYGEENHVATTDDLANERHKRKPRPSLSERTLETLSQIPPSPSPSRRRPSVTSATSHMRPPSRPASSLKSPRSNLNIRAGSVSPSKTAPPLPAFPSCNDKDSTPSRPRTTSSKLATLRHSNYPGRDGGTNIDHEITRERIAKPASQASKAKTLHNPRIGIGSSSTTRPSLASVFRDPPQINAHGSRSSVVTPGKQRPDRPTQAPHRSDTPRKVSSLASKKPTTSLSAKNNHLEPREEQSSNHEVIKIPPKSSLALRETIARAKAAKREAAKQNVGSVSTASHTFDAVNNDFVFEDSNERNVGKVLQKRIESAVTTGFLNIAALRLEDFPQEILSMYEFDENSKIKWSEAVDVTKLIATDNEFEGIPETVFPDWSLRELEEDDDKNNIFAGLQALDFRANRLKSVPLGLRRLTQLSTLNLSNNMLSDSIFEIVSQIPTLKELRLANNNLQGVIPTSISSLAELQVLDLHGNNLSSFHETAASLEKLQKLDLSDNAFQMFPFEILQTSQLTDLNLSKNSLSGVLFARPCQLERLQLLDVAFNQLKSLAEHPLIFPRLQTLACDNNQLVKLPDLSQLKSLTILTAAENKIESIPEGFVNLGNLRNVNLSVNEIKAVDPLIANMEHLIIMDITANPLRDRKYLAMNTADLKVDLARRLTSVTGESDLVFGSPNSSASPPGVLSTPPEHVYRPENGVLNLSAQNITSVDLSSIDLTQPIHTVRLSNNELSTFPMELLVHPSIKDSLKSLDISHNQSLHSTVYLTSHIALPMLQSLNIVSTGLTSLETLVSCLSAPSLRELNISCHRMTGPVPRLKATFPSITTLLATDNWFTSVDVESIRGLEVVDISNNDIDHLPPKLGELGNLDASRAAPGRLRAFECQGNKFRVPRLAILEKGTEAILKDLRRRVPSDQVADEWRDE